jgi:hypothetical protein
MVRRTLTHNDAFDDLGALALGIIDNHEIEALEEHVAGCSICQHELRHISSLVDNLAWAAPAVDPPDDLRNRVLDSLGSTNGSADNISSAPSPPEKKLRGWTRFMLPVAAAIILMLTAWIGVLYQDLSETRQELQATSTQLHDEQVVLANLSQSIELIADNINSEWDDRNYGRLHISHDSSRALLVVENLPPTPPGRVYQIWLVRGEERIDGGTFRTAEDGSGRIMISTPYPLSEFQRMGITEEPAPSGSPGPTGPRVVSCPLS